MPSASAAAATVSVVALALAIAVAVPAEVWKVVPRSTDTGVAPDAGAAVSTLKAELRPGDVVVTANPADAPIRYYFIRDGVDLGYLTATDRSPQRIFVYVNDSGQTVDGVLAKQGVTLDERSETRVVSQFDSGTLYLVTAKQA